MELKNKKVIVGLALAGVSLIASEIKKKRKVDELTKRVYYVEEEIEELDKKTFSIKKYAKAATKAHNNLIKVVAEDYENFNERFFDLEDEIITIYKHIEELDRIKENINGIKKSKIEVERQANKADEKIDDGEEDKTEIIIDCRKLDLGEVIKKIMM